MAASDSAPFDATRSQPLAGRREAGGKTSDPFAPSPLWPTRRRDWPWQEEVATRWRDNDIYGHLNNVVHYELFDACVNRMLIARGLLDPRGGTPIALVVETACRYRRALAYPCPIVVSLGVAALGRRSVTYHLAIHAGDDADDALPAAQGRYVHVLVDREHRRPVPWPDRWRAELARLRLAPTGSGG